MVGTLISLATFVLFYLMTVFALSWGTTALGYGREKFLIMQLFGVLLFALTIPGGILSERGRRITLIWVTVGIAIFGLIMAPLFAVGTAGAVAMMSLGLALMGLTYGPLGTVLSELFPTSVRYTGSSLAFNFAGIFGASLAPYIPPGWRRSMACNMWVSISPPSLPSRSPACRRPRNQRRNPLECWGLAAHHSYVILSV